MKKYWRGSGAGRSVSDVKSVREFTHLCDRVRCAGWLGYCCGLLYVEEFSLRLKGIVYNSCLVCNAV